MRTRHTSMLGVILLWGCAPVDANVVYGHNRASGDQPEAPSPDPDDGDDPAGDDPAGDGAEVDPPDVEDEPEDEPVEDDVAEWTVMVYLNGDNNLEEAALVDLNEMERVGSTDEVNVLVQLDRAAGYVDYDGDWRGARRYRVEADENETDIGSPVLDDIGEVDSGRPGAFIDFIAWGVENFPAKRYAFVIWDHGWGWTAVPTDPRKGISSDDESGNALSIADGDVTEILAQGHELTGGRMDLVGMDACLMANWETARIAAPYTQIFVASQATESLLGWAYDTAIADLVADPEMDAEELGIVIAHRFNQTPDATQSVVDVAVLKDLDTVIDELAAAILDLSDPRAAVSGIARQTQTFDGTYPDRDLGDFVRRIANRSAEHPRVAAVASDTWYQLGEAIVANYTHGDWVADATGLSIYLPIHELDERYLTAPWADLTDWDEMIEAIQ
jgi:hypothetical protein